MTEYVTRQSVVKNALKFVPSIARKVALHPSISQGGLGNQKSDWVFAPFVKNVSLRARLMQFRYLETF
jgi:hypothetical protein